MACSELAHTDATLDSNDDHAPICPLDSTANQRIIVLSIVF